MTTAEKFVTQRLFGRTSIDSLNLHQNAWYIDEEQVTATAAELNAAGDGITTINAYNATGGAFTVGMLLHVSGYDATSGYLKVEKADADASKPAQYVAIDTTANGSTTIIQDYYDAVTFNTVGASAGDPVYLSAATPGAFSLAAPTGTDDVVQIVGRVKLHNSATGTVIIDVRKEEQVQIGTNELVNDSVTSAKVNDDVATGLAGTAANTGLTASSGVLKVDPSDNAVTVASDYIVYQTAAGLPKKDLISDFTTAVAGVAASTGLGSTGGTLVVAPVDAALTVGTDYVHTASATNVPGKVLVSGLATGMAGVQASTALTATSGVLKIDPAAQGFTASTDSAVTVTAGGVPGKTTFANVATGMAGYGLSASGGQLNLSNLGSQGQVAITFTGAGDATSMSIKGINFPIVATSAPHPVAADGEWAIDGGAKGTSIASLNAAINGDTRNGGTSYFTSFVSGDNVIVFDKVAAAGFTVAFNVGESDPVATVLNIGVAPVPGRSYMATKVISALEDGLAGFDIPVPFTPSKFMAFCTTGAGVPLTPSDQFTIQGTPPRIHITAAGASQLVATDIVTIIAME